MDEPRDIRPEDERDRTVLTTLLTQSELDDIQEGLELYAEDRIQAFYVWVRNDSWVDAYDSLEDYRRALYLSHALGERGGVAPRPWRKPRARVRRLHEADARSQEESMGMYDVYEPVPPLACPVCSRPLTEWQGKQGPRLLLVWRQGCANEVGDALDGEPIYRELPGPPLRLPPVFRIHSYDCPDHRPVHARGECENGVWTRTVLLSFEELAR